MPNSPSYKRLSTSDETDASPEQDDFPLLPVNKPALLRSISRATLAAEKLEDEGSYLHEIYRLGQLSIPLIASSVTGFFVSLVGVAFVGRLGQAQLSTAILATSFFNITGLTFLIGSLGAMETLCGQAYGAGNYRQVGIAFQRALLLTLTLAVCVVAVWTQTEKIMLALGQEPSLSAGAARYLHINSPALFFIGAGECLKRYLSSQGVVAPATYSAIAAALAAPIFNYLLIFKLGLGLDGAAFASLLSQFAPCAVLVVWTVRRERKLLGAREQTWYGWSQEALGGWGKYLKLAAPSAAMVCLEWTTFEACIIMAGWLLKPELQVAVMGLSLNYSGALYMLPLGIGAATSIRVSNALGAGLAKGARRAALVATTTATLCALALAVVSILFRSRIGSVFTSDTEVTLAMSSVMVPLALCLTGDGINAVIGGMLRGCGRQELGALINLLAFWVFGLPLAAFLAFKTSLGVAGLWTGLAAAASGNAIMFLVILWKMNWELEAQKALDTFKAAAIDLDGLGDGGLGGNGSGGSDIEIVGTLSDVRITS